MSMAETANINIRKPSTAKSINISWAENLLFLNQVKWLTSQSETILLVSKKKKKKKA